MMFSALILICTLASADASGNCNRDNVLFSAESDPAYSTYEECIAGAHREFLSILPDLRQMMEQNVQYSFNLSCNKEGEDPDFGHKK